MTGAPDSILSRRGAHFDISMASRDIWIVNIMQPLTVEDIFFRNKGHAFRFVEEMINDFEFLKSQDKWQTGLLPDPELIG